MAENNEFHQAKRSMQYPYYNKDDEHTANIAKDVTKACQVSQNVTIQKAQNTAEKAHKRIDDCMDDPEKGVLIRLARLDDPEMGKVTIMFKSFKMFLIYILLGAIAAGGASYMGARASTPQQPDINRMIETAVNAAVKKLGQ